MKKQPNIVFVLTDDQGYGDLSCHGNTILKTPNIDAFYDESVHFTNYHVGPTCAPTRSGLLTSHFANSTGVWHTIGGRSLLRANQVTLADVFKEKGYNTGLFGKWHLGDNYPYRPQDRGFNTVVCHGGGGISQLPDAWGNDYFDDVYSVNGTPTRFEGYCTDVFFNEAKKFIADNTDNPFVCFITCNAPHGPYNVDPKYSAPYADKVTQKDRANFYGMIANVDENFGALKSYLKDLNIFDDTILIFMTDNGTTLGGPEYNTCGMRGYKGSEYDGGHRVPFFISYPNGNINQKIDINELASHVDFMPTLMELCGIDVSEYDYCNFHGTSLKPLLEDSTAKLAERTLVTDNQRLAFPVKWRHSAVMTNQWRLINGTELYDINADLGQTNDIAATHPEVVTQLRAEYEKWWKLVTPEAFDEIPISIGSVYEEETRLTSHDWRNHDQTIPTDPFAKEYNDYLVFHQGQVRQGPAVDGYWEIMVEQAGRYRFELMRWPKEENRPITAGIEDSTEDWYEAGVPEHYHFFYRGGKALPLTSAEIVINDFKQTIPVEENDHMATFEVFLPKGPVHLSGAFYTESQEKYGAYFAYASRIK